MPRQPGFGVLNTATRLAVWGDPIDHSRSPRLHAAAYRVLGLDWEYGRRRVSEESFDDALRGLDRSWRGLSITFPLKTVAFAASGSRDRRAELTGAVNTLLLTGDAPQGFNTDIGGMVAALKESGLERIRSARIVGAGATATSALVAVGELGVERVEVVARRPEAAQSLRALGTHLGIVVTAIGLDAPAFDDVDVTIATLPGDAVIPDRAAATLAASGGFLLDVVYGHWPTRLATAWDHAGGTAISGLGMLLHQAVLQIRIFVAGDPLTVLDDEGGVLDAMRRAVVED